MTNKNTSRPNKRVTMCFFDFVSVEIRGDQAFR